VTEHASRADASYVVRRWSGLWHLALGLAPVLLVGVALGVARDRLVVNALTVGVVLVLAARGFDRVTAVLRVDGYGVAWSRPSTRLLLSDAQTFSVPWSSIQGVEVVEGEAVRVRLRPDAPLPASMRGRVVDPERPTLLEGPAPGVSAAPIRDVAARNAPNVPIVAKEGITPQGGTESGR
jgi:hypothetical protein